MAASTPVVRRAVTGAAKLLSARWLVRAPIWAYRARLGALFGSRLVMLEHTGRTSGRRRFVVLEVVGHPARDTYLVVSGFGARAQWFRNVQANPQVRLYTGSHRPIPAKASTLTSGRARAALAAYAAARPRTWAALKPVLEHTLGAELTDLPMVALDLVRGPGGEVPD
jgi:deazaflavin-dependent oxidoreductase (nitroreductase family)